MDEREEDNQDRVSRFRDDADRIAALTFRELELLQIDTARGMF
jgi:hypothetical protein